MTYPSWSYFPRNERPPQWTLDFVNVVAKHRLDIDTTIEGMAERLSSDGVTQLLRPDLEALGYQVERGKKAQDKIYRPVLFGENGAAEVTYEIDAFHDELGIAVEIEAGRGAKGNADYRDIVRTSLLLDANFMVLALPITYRYGAAGARASAYASTRAQLSAIYASQRLRLPFEGVLLIGY